MFNPALDGVFINAALPQKVVLIVLLAAVPIVLVAALQALRAPGRAALWRRIISDLRFAGPALGLLVAGLNSFHIGETIQRLPFEPTLKQLAPGIFEVSAFVVLGPLVGLVAVVAHAAVSFMNARQRTL